MSDKKKVYYTCKLGYFVLVRDYEDQEWERGVFVNCVKGQKFFVRCDFEGYTRRYNAMLPYIDDTARFEGTLNTPDVEYIYSEAPEEKPEPTFEPFQKVLMRDNDYEPWRAEFYSQHGANYGGHRRAGGGYYRQCIPYEGNEHLVGTTDMPEVGE